jgi:hypothetical protein
LVNKSRKLFVAVAVLAGACALVAVGLIIGGALPKGVASYFYSGPAGRSIRPNASIIAQAKAQSGNLPSAPQSVAKQAQVTDQPRLDGTLTGAGSGTPPSNPAQPSDQASGDQPKSDNGGETASQGDQGKSSDQGGSNVSSDAKQGEEPKSDNPPAESSDNSDQSKAKSDEKAPPPTYDRYTSPGGEDVFAVTGVRPNGFILSEKSTFAGSSDPSDTARSFIIDLSDMKGDLPRKLEISFVTLERAGQNPNIATITATVQLIRPYEDYGNNGLLTLVGFLPGRTVFYQSIGPGTALERRTVTVLIPNQKYVGLKVSISNLNPYEANSYSVFVRDANLAAQAEADQAQAENPPAPTTPRGGSQQQ